MTNVWKFGYGSNMGETFLREKKGLEPLDSRRCVLKGWSLSFPEGKGIDMVEPSFASLKQDAPGQDPPSEVHGVSVLFSPEDAKKLDDQEPPNRMHLEVQPYAQDEETPTLTTEVYMPKNPLPIDQVEGSCSDRYRSILVNGAIEADLSPTWIEKLRKLAIYTPSPEILSLRDTFFDIAAIQEQHDLPLWSLETLKKYDGNNESEEFKHHISSCGFIFKHKEFFKSFHGRDVCYRNVLHRRGISLDKNDDPTILPKIDLLQSEELEYALRYRDRFFSKAGMPVALLKDFWEKQDKDFLPVFKNNIYSSI